MSAKITCLRLTVKHVQSVTATTSVLHTKLSRPTPIAIGIGPPIKHEIAIFFTSLMFEVSSDLPRIRITVRFRFRFRVKLFGIAALIWNSKY